MKTIVSLVIMTLVVNSRPLERPKRAINDWILWRWTVLETFQNCPDHFANLTSIAAGYGCSLGCLNTTLASNNIFIDMPNNLTVKKCHCSVNQWMENINQAVTRPPGNQEFSDKTTTQKTSECVAECARIVLDGDGNVLRTGVASETKTSKQKDECYFSSIRYAEQEKERPRVPTSQVSTKCGGRLNPLKNFYKNTEFTYNHGVENEADLIMARGAGLFLDWSDKNIQDQYGNIKICSEHVKELRSQWERGSHYRRKGGKKLCSLPEAFMKGYDEHLAKDRTYVTKSSAKAMLQKHGILLHIGLPLCRDHRMMMDKLFSEVTVINAGRQIFPPPETGDFCTAKLIESDEEVYSCPEQKVSQSSQFSSQGSSFLCPSEPKESQPSQMTMSNKIPQLHCSRKTKPEICAKLWEFGEVSEIPSLQPRKAFSELSNRQKDRRAHSLSDILKISADCMAGSESSDQLIRSVLGENRNNQPTGSDDMDELLTYASTMFYHIDTRQERIALLSMFSRTLPYSYIEKYIPSLSRRYYSESRRYALDPSSITKPVKRTVTKLHRIQLNQFIDYITGPSVMIGLPFGEKTVKTSSGAAVRIPNTIRLFRHEQIYRNYIDYLTELGQCSGAISRSTALRILKVCSADKRKSLACIDEFIAEADDGFTTIQNHLDEVAKLFEPNRLKSLSRKLLEVKQYLRGDFRLHAKNYSRVADHCITHSLSNFKEKNFKEDCSEQGENSHAHNVVCPRCEMEKNTLGEIQNIFEQLLSDARSSSDKNQIIKFEDMTTDVLEAIERIKNLKRHQVRAAHSNKVKEKLIENLKYGEALIIMDFSQKILQMRFRESQQQYFGKRGMSLHVAHVTTVNPKGGLMQHSFLHALGVETQDGEAVTAIVKHCLHILKQYGIKKVILRSDNAGCYHSQGTILSMPLISKETSIHITAYEFSEAQAGKSTADRIISMMKRRVRDYVDSGHNVLNADDLYAALNFPKPLDGMSIHTGTIVDRESAETKTKFKKFRNSISQIQEQYSFTFLQDGTIRYRNFYELGIGRTTLAESYLNANYKASFKSERSTDLNTVKFWSGDADIEVPFGDQPEAEVVHKTSVPAVNLAGNVNPIIAEGDEMETETQDLSTTAAPLTEGIIEDAEADAQIPNTAHGTLFECPEPTCGKRFIRLSNLARHIQIGKHDKNPEVVRMEDYVLQAYADKLETLDPKNTFASLTGNEHFLAVETVDNEKGDDVVKMGWARKPKRIHSTYSESARNYVANYFYEGKRIKKKFDPKFVADEMKKAVLDTGERRFTVQERLNYKQVASLFSSLARADRSEKSVKPAEHNEEEENEDLDYRTDPYFQSPFDELLERVETAETLDENGVNKKVFDLKDGPVEFIPCDEPNSASDAKDPDSFDEPGPSKKMKKS